MGIETGESGSGLLVRDLQAAVLFVCVRRPQLSGDSSEERCHPGVEVYLRLPTE